jgi:polar amino acid transport system ATP-binding protein
MTEPLSDPTVLARQRDVAVPMVKAERVCKSFGHTEVLKGIDLEVAHREVLCIIGPSGSGKSTFLRCINHLEKINAGRLSVDGQLIGYRQRGDRLYEMKESEVAAQRRDIGMVFQRFNLFPHMSALENVMEAPHQVKGESKTAAREQAQDLLNRVGLGDRANSYPSQLSGGQQQRVAIARALVSRPSVVFADEPTGNLDSATSGDILALMRASVDDLDQTTVMVTHDARAAAIADRILFLADGLIVRDLPRSEPHAVIAAMEELAAS